MSGNVAHAQADEQALVSPDHADAQQSGLAEEEEEVKEELHDLASQPAGGEQASEDDDASDAKALKVTEGKQQMMGKGEKKKEPAGEKTEKKKDGGITVEDINTAPMDFRFPTTNQAKHCFTRYNEYHKCVKEKGEGEAECNKYAKYYRSLCPGEWIERWNEQRENGTFPGPY